MKQKSVHAPVSGGSISSSSVRSNDRIPFSLHQKNFLEPLSKQRTSDQAMNDELQSNPPQETWAYPREICDKDNRTKVLQLLLWRKEDKLGKSGMKKKRRLGEKRKHQSKKGKLLKNSDIRKGMNNYRPYDEFGRPI